MRIITGSVAPCLPPLFSAWLLLVGSQGLSMVETEDLRLLYFDPTETYLVPRAIQTFHEFPRTPKAVFSVTQPTEKTTVLLLTDFSRTTATVAPCAVPEQCLVIHRYRSRHTVYVRNVCASRTHVHADEPRDGSHRGAGPGRPRRIFKLSRKFFQWQGSQWLTDEHPETLLLSST